MNLKRQVQDLQGQIEQKDGELDFLKKKIKLTKIVELEAELEVAYQHLYSLRAHIASMSGSKHDELQLTA